jgi:hypothetical protein
MAIKYTLNIGAGLTEKEKMIKKKLREENSSTGCTIFFSNLFGIFLSETPESQIFK